MYDKIQKAQEMINHYPELKGWYAIPGSSRKVHGTCHYKEQVIELHKLFLDNADDSTITNTIKHEIAHALGWVRHKNTGHNATFYRICESIGAEPRRLSRFTNPYKYLVRCTQCGKVFKRGHHRRVNLDNYCCNDCKGNLELILA